jgi:hypothetical protein
MSPGLPRLVGWIKTQDPLTITATGNVWTGSLVASRPPTHECAQMTHPREIYPVQIANPSNCELINVMLLNLGKVCYKTKTNVNNPFLIFQFSKKFSPIWNVSSLIRKKKKRRGRTSIYEDYTIFQTLCKTLFMNYFT